MAPLREKFEKAGTWLFRWRSFLPLLLPALFLEAFRGSNIHMRATDWLSYEKLYAFNISLKTINNY